MISHAQFQQYAAEGFNRIPVVREVLSDLDTPLSVYLKLADAPYTYLFESVEGGERFGRYSIIGLPVRRVATFRGHTLQVHDHGQLVETREVANPFAEVEALRAAYAVPKLEGLPGFTGTGTDYQPPSAAELVLDTATRPVLEAVGEIERMLLASHVLLQEPMDIAAHI